ncbi:MAG: restriction endonuclease subunit S [Nocardioides sp.]
MSEWRETTLGEVVRLEYGKALPDKARDGEGSPVLGSNGVVGHHSQALVAGPGIVVGRKGTAGSVTYVEEDFFPIDTTYYATITTGIGSMRFAQVLLQHAGLPSVCAQTGVPGLNRDRAYEIPIALPPLDEQRRIVDVVAAVDAQIEALEVESAAAWDTYLNATAVLWGTDSGDEAGLTRLSDVMTLDVCRVTLDHATEYRLAGVLNAGKGIVDKGVLAGAQTEYAAMNRLGDGQVVMRKLTAWEGPIAVVPKDFDGFVASNEFPTFSLGQGVAPTWFAHVCRTPRLWDEMKLRVTGSVQRRKRLNPDQLLSVELPIPPLETQRRSAAALDVLLKARADTSVEAARLCAFRSTLLTALLSQTISIPDSYDALLADELPALEGAYA